MDIINLISVSNPMYILGSRLRCERAFSTITKYKLVIVIEIFIIRCRIKRYFIHATKFNVDPSQVVFFS